MYTQCDSESEGDRVCTKSLLFSFYFGGIFGWFVLVFISRVDVEAYRLIGYGYCIGFTAVRCLGWWKLSCMNCCSLVCTLLRSSAVFAWCTSTVGLKTRNDWLSEARFLTAL